jgi:hypothetical protein
MAATNLQIQNRLNEIRVNLFNQNTDAATKLLNCLDIQSDKIGEAKYKHEFIKPLQLLVKSGLLSKDEFNELTKPTNIN